MNNYKKSTRRTNAESESKRIQKRDLTFRQLLFIFLTSVWILILAVVILTTFYTHNKIKQAQAIETTTWATITPKEVIEPPREQKTYEEFMIEWERLHQIRYEEQKKDNYEEITKELKENAVVKNTFDINKLAYAVAMQETANCTKWYWVTHNNCFWIKHWNTVPCPWVRKLAMCKFETKEASYEAFKIIWSKWYWEVPNYRMAKKWSWDDRTGIWLKNVLYYYNK